ncbi:MAG: hypothetical protein Q8J97_08190, partial [Flavobacteriaceae bacterium]|nr:hypothetical protein [Flavobacteriaceae bacterium]
MKTHQLKIIVAFILFLTACDDIIEVPNISKKSVVLLAPAEGAVLTNTDVRFTWQEVEDADEYVIQVAFPNFANASQIVLDTVVVGRNFNKMLTPNSYEWRVKAINSGFMTAYTTRSFE